MPEERRKDWVTKEDFERLEKKIDTLCLLITGNGTPEKGLSTRVIGMEEFLDDLGYHSSNQSIDKRVSVLEIAVTRIKEYIENIQNRFVIPAVMFVVFGGFGFLWSLWVGKISFTFH